jgi:acetyl esterase/lipase
VSLDPELARRIARIAAGEPGTIMAEPVAGYTPPSCAVTDERIARVPVRRYGDAATPAIIWLHGGV